MPYTLQSTTTYEPPLSFSSSTRSVTFTESLTHQLATFPPEPPEGEPQTAEPTFATVTETDSYTTVSTSYNEGRDGSYSSSFRTGATTNNKVGTSIQGLVQFTFRDVNEFGFSTSGSNNRSRTVPGTDTDEFGNTFTIPFTEKDFSQGTTTIGTTTVEELTQERERTTTVEGLAEFDFGTTKWTTFTDTAEDQTGTFTFLGETMVDFTFTTITGGGVPQTITLHVTTDTPERTVNTFTCDLVTVVFPNYGSLIYQNIISETGEPSVFAAYANGSFILGEPVESHARAKDFWGIGYTNPNNEVFQSSGLEGIKSITFNTVVQSNRVPFEYTRQTRILASNAYVSITSSQNGEITQETERNVNDGILVERTGRATYTRLYFLRNTVTYSETIFPDRNFNVGLRSLITYTSTKETRFAVQGADRFTTSEPALAGEITTGQTLSFTASTHPPSYSYGTRLVDLGTGYGSGFADNAVRPSESMEPPFGIGFVQPPEQWTFAARALRYSVPYAEIITSLNTRPGSSSVVFPIGSGSNRIGTPGLDESFRVTGFTGTTYKVSMDLDTAMFSAIYTTEVDGSQIKTTEKFEHVYETLFSKADTFLKWAFVGHWYNSVTSILSGYFSFTSFNFTGNQTQTGTSLLPSPQTITINPKHGYLTSAGRVYQTLTNQNDLPITHKTLIVELPGTITE